MKRFIALLLLGLSLTLVGCKRTPAEENPDNGGNNGTELTDSERLDAALLEFDNKNYQMDIEILRNGEIETSIQLRFEDNVSHYVEGEYVEEFYVRDNRNLTTYIKNYDKFEVSTSREPKDDAYLIFNQLDFNWFTVTNNSFVLKTNNFDDFFALFGFKEGFALEAASLELTTENFLSKLTYEFSLEDETTYQVTHEFTNWNNVSITLPQEG